MVQKLTICKLPYQDHPFVHGVRDGMDVWLMTNGEWTETDGHPNSSIPFASHLSDALAAKDTEIEQLRKTLDECWCGDIVKQKNARIAALERVAETGKKLAQAFPETISADQEEQGFNIPGYIVHEFHAALDALDGDKT